MVPMVHMYQSYHYGIGIPLASTMYVHLYIHVYRYTIGVTTTDNEPKSGQALRRHNKQARRSNPTTAVRLRGLLARALGADTPQTAKRECTLARRQPSSIGSFPVRTGWDQQLVHGTRRATEGGVGVGVG
jgi:hypothetical protein